MSQTTSVRVPASTEGLSSESQGESASARSGWAIGSAVAFTVAAAVGVVHTGLGIVAAVAVVVWLVQTCTLRAFACLAGLDGGSVWAGVAGPAAAAGLGFLKAVTAIHPGICKGRTPTEPLKSTRRRPADDPWT